MEQNERTLLKTFVFHSLWPVRSTKKPLESHQKGNSNKATSMNVTLFLEDPQSKLISSIVTAPKADIHRKLRGQIVCGRKSLQNLHKGNRNCL